MNCPSRLLEIDAWGWTRPDWTPEFYPEDLPPEWRLTYYANEHGSVLVPANYWWSPEFRGVQSWCEDVNQSFRFYLEVTGALQTHESAWPVFLDQLQQFGDRFGGVLINVRDRKRGVAAVATIHSRLGLRPVYSIINTGLDGGIAWSGTSTPCPCGPFGLVSLAEACTPRELSAIVEQFATCASDSWLRLFVDGSPQQLRNLQTIAHLLGFSPSAD